jgi:hypothetical protein
MSDGNLERFLGGKPLSVAIRLAVISVVVGALLYWTGLSPLGLLRGVQRMVEGLLGSGFDAVRSLGEFLMIGAVVVIPIWLIARALAARKG